MTTTTPGPMRALNALGRRTGDLGRLGRLDPDELLADARRRTGLSDLGPDTDHAYRLLIASLDSEARLTTIGRVVFGRLGRAYLAQRLRVVDTLRRRPDLAAAPVARPLFVVGLPRTGTTLLHSLLAQAEGGRPLRSRDAIDPVPPVLRGGGRDLRALRYWLSVRGLYYLGPGRRRLHDYDGDAVECLRLLARSFLCFAFPNMVDVPSYERWLWEQPPDAFVPAYELHRMQLQTLAADGARSGYWVLKAPAHLNTLEALLAVYPDAAVVQTHRDPVRTVGSVSSLVARNHALLAESDARRVGPRVLRDAERAFARIDRTRAAVGERIMDVRYADLLADPVGVVRGIHQRFGYPSTPAAECRMRGWLAANPQGKHGVHRYTLEQFGLDRAAVERVAAPYRERFNLQPER